MTDQSFILRAQQVIHNAPGEITARDAIKQVLKERYPNYDQLLEAATTLGSSIQSKLRQSTYDLPDMENTLFDIPQVISVTTPDDGVTFVRRDEAELWQVRQFFKDGDRYHKVQGKRFAKGIDEIALLDAEPENLKWPDAQLKLEAIKRKSVES